MKINLSNIDYSTFVGLTQERNRPSGGIRTIHSVAKNSFINKDSKMLEIGSNTGFTCVNMALLTKCFCIGIDVNAYSVKEAINYSREQGVSNRVKFIQANAEKIPFKDNSFDVVWCSNVTSFIKDKEKAIMEYLRVLKTGGTLVVIPIYYLKNPGKKMIRNISKAINSEIRFWKKDFWINLFTNISKKYTSPLELYFNEDYVYLNRKKEIPYYVKKILKNPHITKMTKNERKIIGKKLKEFMELFNENLKYAGFSILLFQKRKENEEVELFLTKKR